MTELLVKRHLGLAGGGKANEFPGKRIYSLTDLPCSRYKNQYVPGADSLELLRGMTRLIQVIHS